MSFPDPDSPATTSSRAAPKTQRVLACEKAGAKCVPGAATSRPRRRRFAERELLERLRYYESLLRQSDIKFEPLHATGAESVSPGGEERAYESTDDVRSGEWALIPNQSEKTVIKSETVYEAKNFWLAMNQRPQHIDDADADDDDDDIGDSAHDEVLRGVEVDRTWKQGDHRSDNLLLPSSKANVPLSTSHPGQIQIFRLWQVYLENVNPLLKVTHTPTLQARIINAASDVTTLNPSLEALMFSIYCVALLSLADDECRTLLGSSRKDLLERYQSACQQALLNCEYLRSSDCECLTAFYLYLVSVRPDTDPRTLSSMLGAAIRIAQRVGIHIESANAKCSVFDAEMRRRLWWSLVVFDSRVSELSDYKNAILAPTWDCKIPLNVDDSDLRSEMTLPPAIHGKPTGAIFTVARSELGEFIRHSSSHLDFTNPALKSLAKGTEHGLVPEGKRIVNLEKTMEDKYLKDCNPENPLHFMALWTARGHIAKARLVEGYARHSMPFEQRTDAQRDAGICDAIKLLKCDTKLVTSPLTKGYLWHIHLHFPFPAYIHIVQDLRKRPAAKYAEQAWQAMSENYQARFGKLKEDDNPFVMVFTKIFRVFSRLVLQAWEARQMLFRQLGKPLEQPLIVRDMKRTLQKMTPTSRVNNAVSVNAIASGDDFNMPISSGFGNLNLMYGTEGAGGYSDAFGEAAMEVELDGLDWTTIDWSPMHVRELNNALKDKDKRCGQDPDMDIGGTGDGATGLHHELANPRRYQPRGDIEVGIASRSFTNPSSFLFTVHFNTAELTLGISASRSPGLHPAPLGPGPGYSPKRHVDHVNAKPRTIQGVQEVFKGVRAMSFDEVQDKRISVPESYLLELQNQSARGSAGPRATGANAGLSRESSAAIAEDDGTGSIGGDMTGYQDDMSFDAEEQTPRQPIDPRLDVGSPVTANVPSNDGAGSKFRQNPLVDTDYTFAQAHGKYWYMGPSSSWSFCRRVLALIGKRVPESNCAPDPYHLDGVAFKMQWKPLGRDEAPDISNLPPLDYALFLFNTVKFYFGVIFHLIDEPSYLHDLHELYRDTATKASQSRLWYAQYLLILAFGKAIVNNSGPRDTPSGYQYAVRAMSLMPDLSGMDVDNHQSIQALTLAALYLQSIDMRVAAFQHIGQALRTCTIEGFHRHMPEEVVGAPHSKRSNTLFWIVYMLEGEFSALIGGPSTIHDKDITAKLPSQVNAGLDAWNMNLHVQLSRLTARILTTVYGVGEEFDGSLIKNTQSILRNLAQISQDLTSLLRTHFQGSINKASRMALRLVLAYHHCVVLTTRPLVMCALHVHIDEGRTQANHPISLTPPVSSLISSCVDSAQTMLRTLRVLGDEDLLEAFLPFQLEDAFSSAFILSLIHAISPSLVQDDSWRNNVTTVLDRMIAQGSLVAPLRKLELNQLESITDSLTPYEKQPPTPIQGDDPPQRHEAAILGHDSRGIEIGWDQFVDTGMMGLSPTELLELAEQLNVDLMIDSEAIYN
ncbi:hypothetical protein G7046_g724 [Stylonectria norvegica]|nr:hypothetical protein G7046_g724 [Stylonectria norvegica]